MNILAATLACVGCSSEDGNSDPGAGLPDTGAASRGSAFSARAKQVLDQTDRLLERSRRFQEADALAALPANPLTGFHYRFDDHLADASFEATGTAPETETDSSPQVAPISIALAPVQSPYRTIQQDGRTAIQIDHQAGDLLRNTTPLRLAKDQIAEFELRLKLHHHATVILGWSSDDALDLKLRRNQAQESVSWIRIDTVPDGRFHTYRVNARNALQAAKNPGDIQHVFLRFPKERGDQIEVEPLRILSSRDRFSRDAIGTDYVELQMEMRHVIYGEAPFELEYTVAPPEGRVSFHAGVASLEPNAPVTFSLVLREAAGERVLLRKEVLEAGTWNDVQFDFESTGEPMTLAFRTESPSSNIAFWSNPILYGPRDQPFNILLILQDTLRADHLSAYGYFRPTSPRFDAYAKQGVLFERAFSNASKTRPSAASMMTGLYPTAVGVWNFHEMLDDRFITLAEVLRSQGFATAAFVGNPNAGPYAGVHQGFSVLVHQFAGREQQSHERYLIRTIEDILSDRLYDWLEEVRGRNFFLYIHLVDPHGVYDAPAPYDRWYREKLESEPVLDYDVRLDPLHVGTPTADGRRRLYDGEIRYNDEYLAKFLEGLNERELLRRTLVIFASDHGEFLGDRDDDLWAHDPPGYADVLHVPLMMVLPGTLPEGK
ncbi:MAG: sulfatase, partial [Myxococcota bacterium]